ncbi:MAG: FAD-dependent monooxygenase [Rhodospirillales bacterium]|nr:FAD-dependent monooxygenase [Acetobacter sp.]
MLIVGAGPTGLTLACEFARCSAGFLLIEATSGPQPRSRGKSILPCTLEVFDDPLRLIVFAEHIDQPAPVEIQPFQVRSSTISQDHPKPLSAVKNFETMRSGKAMPGTLQEGGAPFHTTHWSVVLLAAQSQSFDEAQRALTDFCQGYWPPIYAFLRRRGYPRSDAQDLTQGFFAHLLEQDTLSRADREKGRLRTFLLGSLQHFLANEYDRAHALKRGGGLQIVSMDEHLAEAEATMSAALHSDERSSYDQNWAVTLMGQAWEQLERAFAAEGKSRVLGELKSFVVGGAAAPPSQEETAARLQVPISTLRTWLQRLRGRYRDALRTEVGRTVSAPSEIDEEMRYLHHLLVS